MGKENELLQLVKLEDVAGVTRLLHKFRANKPKLLGTGRRMNLNAQDADGLCSLHQAALLGNANLMTMLLECGAYVDLKDNRGMRALHFASWQGQAQLVSILLQWNSSVNEAANDGSTPMHLACQYGHAEVVERLLCYFHANPALRNKDNRTPFDLACEFGRLQILELLLSSNKCLSLLEESEDDMADNNRTTALHLAAKNGHLDIIRCLLKHRMDINRSTLRGTCLHEAALYGRFEVVKLLIESGVDVNKPNSYDQTALDIVKTMTSSSRAGRDIRHMLKEAANAVEAVCVKDYHPLADPQGLSLREGEHVTVLEQNEDGPWRGVVFGDNCTSRAGYFPSSAVALLNRQVGGMQGGGGGRTSKLSQAKKVAPPVIPGQEILQNRNSSTSRNSLTSALQLNNNNSLSGREMCDNSLYISLQGGGSCTSSPVHPYGSTFASQHVVAQSFLSPRGGSASSTASSASFSSQPNSPHPSDEGSTISSSSYGGGGGYQPHQHQSATASASASSSIGSSTPQSHPPPQLQQPLLYHHQTSLEDQGIDVQSPGRDSPGSSGSSSGSGCRHSITSLDSGRASSSAYDGRVGHVFLSGTNQQQHSHFQHRLSAHSYESSTSLRQSYHSTSSSSSLGSMDRLDENTPTTPNYSPAQINVSKLLRDGLPETEVLRRWLVEQRFEEYYHLFIQAGYDMPTISRMTPEDMTAIGITNPSHRKKLKVEIGKLNISDGLPDYIPNCLNEWLCVLRLEEYAHCLQQQGYSRVSDVTGIAWEDLEEIGIQRLGHQKKIMLAIKRVKDIQSGIKRFSTSAATAASDIICHRPNASPNQPLEVKCQVLNSSQAPFQPYVESSDNSALLIPPPSAYASSAAVNDEYLTTNNVSSPSHIIYRPDIVAIQVRHPSGARSLENLESDNRNSTHQTFLQPDAPVQCCRWSTQNSQQNVMFSSQQPPQPSLGPLVATQSQWRRGSLDDGDITPTNESVYDVMEGGGTLPRPKVSIKPRPVAKIMAKTRTQAETEVLSGCADSLDVSVENLKSENTTVVAAEIHSSPLHTNNNNNRRSLPSSPMNTVFRNLKKVPPPPPPKRTNSMNEKNQNQADYSNEQLFASCVKSIASKFGLSSSSSSSSAHKSSEFIASNSSNKSEASSPSDEGSDLSLSLEISEPPDRTPPSPAPGSPVHHRPNAGSNRASPYLTKRNNESFESVASSSSSSSSNNSKSEGGATNLPFANENVGTIKQRLIKPHPPISKMELGSRAAITQPPVPRSAPATPKRRSSLKGNDAAPSVVVTPPQQQPAPSSSSLSSAHSLDVQDEDKRRSSFEVEDGGCTGDVLSDIDNMLANLTEELDAMLTNELQSS